MLQAIIFDMDGVIVDTEFVEFNTQKQFIFDLQPNHHQIDPTAFSQLVGRSIKDIPFLAKQISGSTLPIAEIEQRFADYFKRAFQNLDYRTIFRRDILAIIDFAKQYHIKLAVASSSTLAHINEILSCCSIQQQFDLIVSGEIFEQSKPDPTIYRYTLEKLGVSADNVIAVEDSYYGMVVAKGAGLRVIGYQETRMNVDQSLADFMATDMKRVFEIIQRL